MEREDYELLATLFGAVFVIAFAVVLPFLIYGP